MKKYIALALLALVTVTCAVVEGLVEGVSPLFIQMNGLFTIVCTGVFFASWIMSVKAEVPGEN